MLIGLFGQPRSLQARSTCRGFTLIEILVVVAIISLLVGIGIAVGTRAQRSAIVNACKITLGQAQAAADAYAFKFANTNPIINWKDTKTTQEDWDQNKNFNVLGITGNLKLKDTSTIDYSIERFVYVAYQIPECRSQLEVMGQQVFLDSDGNGFLDIVDPWGRKLVYRDSDYTGIAVPSDTESGSELPRNNSPYFASAGPDGKWGNWTHLQTKRSNPSSLTADQTTQATNAEDNLYSFEIK